MGSRAVGAALRRRPRNARPAGNHPRHRRRARAQGARLDPGGLAPQRRPRGVRRAAAHPRSHRSRACRSTTRSRKCGGRRCSRRTRRCRPGTTRSRSAWSKRTWPAAGARSASTATVPAARRLRQRRRPAVQHDGAGAAHGAAASTPSASCTARSRARCGRRSGRACRTSERPVSAITNGVHVPTWMSSEMAQLFDEYLRRDWRDRHDDPALWARVLDIPGRGAVGRAPGAAAVPVRVHPRARAAALERRAGQRRARRRRRHAARSERADDRLRAPLHRLQAARS